MNFSIDYDIKKAKDCKKERSNSSNFVATIK